MASTLWGAEVSGASALSIILVHSVLVTISGWQHGHGELVARGLEAIATRHPTISLEGDVAVVGRLIAAIRHLGLLIGQLRQVSPIGHASVDL
jgi:hypothetical protein